MLRNRCYCNERRTAQLYDIALSESKSVSNSIPLAGTRLLPLPLAESISGHLAAFTTLAQQFQA